MAKAKKITYIRGDTQRIKVIATNQDDGSIINLTGSTLTLTVNPNRAPADSSADVLQIIKNTFVDSGDDPVNGIAYITITHIETNSIAPGVYFYDIQLVDSGGNYTTYGPSVFQIVGDITR